MPRTYSVTFENVAVSAVQDLVQVKGATGKMLRVLRAWAKSADGTAPTNQQLRLRCKVMTATVTDGSGGSSPTPAPLDQGDSAATFTAKANNTTQATTSGSTSVVDVDGPNVFGGYDNAFLRPPTVASGQSFVFELLAAPSGTVHLSGGVTVEEIG